MMLGDSALCTRLTNPAPQTIQDYKLLVLYSAEGSIRRMCWSMMEMRHSLLVGWRKTATLSLARWFRIFQNPSWRKASLLCCWFPTSRRVTLIIITFSSRRLSYSKAISCSWQQATEPVNGKTTLSNTSDWKKRCFQHWSLCRTTRKLHRERSASSMKAV